MPRLSTSSSINFRKRSVSESTLPPIVFVNALGQGPAAWSRLRDRVGGHPTSVWSPELSWTRTEQEEQLARLLSGRSAHLVAWCTGPKTALRVAADYPELVESLVFLNPSFKGPGRPLDIDTEYESELVDLLSTVRSRPGMAARLIDALNRRRASNPSSSIGLPAELDDPGTSVFRDAATLIAYAERHLEFWADDPLMDPRVKALEVPTTVVSGAQDVVVAPSDVARIAASFPRSNSVEVNGGHFALYTHSDEVAQALSAHLAAAEVSPGSLSLPR
ncbi:alpha/beta fold hydrolase [Nocardia suismassiliense]|uniref:Alpha/beta fold hydrolase n=1 Tax=Nocardia suismassiliense TaxID=2077092 RepID=A0ABW6R0R5_9NOCA